MELKSEAKGKTMKIAIFSNGHTDVYKGKRAVKAAWMFEYKGKTYSGHSLDAEKANKTANNTLRSEADCEVFKQNKAFNTFYMSRNYPISCIGRVNAHLKKHGFKSTNELAAARRIAIDNEISGVKIEIVTI